MKKVTNWGQVKNDPRIEETYLNYDGYGRHMVMCKDGFRFENERTIEIGNVKEICYSINNSLDQTTTAARHKL